MMAPRLISARLRAPSGQSLVEFALVIPVFLLLVMGVADLGRGILYSNMLDNAAREAARTGSVASATVKQICDALLNQAQVPGLGSTSCSSAASDVPWTDGALTLTIHRGTAGNPADPDDQVTVDYTFTPITPMIEQIILLATDGTTISIRASSSMYVEAGS